MHLSQGGVEAHMFIRLLLEEGANALDAVDRLVGHRIGAALVFADLHQQLDLLVLRQQLAQPPRRRLVFGGHDAFITREVEASTSIAG